jgi:hypothetical protein
VVTATSHPKRFSMTAIVPAITVPEAMDEAIPASVRANFKKPGSQLISWFDTNYESNGYYVRKP